MKIVKEAYTENCKVVYDPDYVTIQHASGGEPVHMSIAEAREVVEWLSHELNRVLPEVIPMHQIDPGVWEKKLPEVMAKGPSIPVYEPGPRTATQTVEIKVGDPNLAYRHTGGRSAVAGDGDAGIMDLGALALREGRI